MMNAKQYAAVILWIVAFAIDSAPLAIFTATLTVSQWFPPRGDTDLHDGPTGLADLRKADLRPGWPCAGWPHDNNPEGTTR